MSPQQEALHKLGIGNDKLCSNSSIKNERQSQQPRESLSPPPPLHVRVPSLHAVPMFDVVKILTKVFIFTADCPVQHHFGKTSLVAQLKPLATPKTIAAGFEC